MPYMHLERHTHAPRPAPDMQSTLRRKEDHT
jgi:hypothetical protein